MRLGSELCPTPVELNKQFDHLAELAYPDRRADSMASVMGDEYKKIIAASKLWLYKSVALNQVPTTIDEWKKAVANRWAADKDVEATIAQLPRTGTDGASRGRANGRGVGAGRGTGRGASEAVEAAEAAEAAVGVVLWAIRHSGVRISSGCMTNIVASTARR